MMNAGTLDCRDTARRGAVRAASSNGIDYVEVSDDQLTLRVFFLGKAPAEIGTRNVRIEGGLRVRDIRVLDVHVHREPRRGRDDWMDVVVDRPGDFASYTLRLIDPGSPERPMAGFDQRYASVAFSFKAGCPSDLDCAAEPSCATTITAAPDISYLARDYTGFRQLLLDRLSVIMPEWRERHVPDIGIALVELLAYTGDYLSQYQDAVATEAYLETARLRISVRRHARLVDYRLFEGCNARAWLTVDARTDFDLDLGLASFVTRYAGAREGRSQILWRELSHLMDAQYVVFEPLWPARPEVMRIHAAHSRIELYTWGDGECCLPKGATEATLIDAWLPPKPTPAPNDREHYTRRAATSETIADGRKLDALAVGDVLILEEVIGPRTGVAADADPAHRHAVRIVELQRDVDSLYPTRDTEPRGTPVVHVRWCLEDALPFALCVSTHKPAPDCGALSGVSVARGNVILVDHGRSVSELLPPVPGQEPAPVCDPCDDLAPTPAPPRYEPTLTRAPLTFAAPLDPSACASVVMSSSGRTSLPQASLEAIAESTANAIPVDKTAKVERPHGETVLWSPRPDLLDVAPADRAFVAEMDDDGFAHLRFAGPASRPARGTSLLARYRVGLGPVGNVGPDSIALVVSEDILAGGVEFTVRNPLAAAGGMAPESLADARLLAPNAFRQIRERAVIAADYAELLERDLGAEVQGAASALRWTGSWYEAQVGIDARGSEEASTRLLRRARGVLHRYRRIGHDVRVSSARLVPLAVTLDVCVASHEARAAVRAALLSALGSGRARDGRLGFFHPDNLRYGEGVSVSALVVAAARVAGVASLAVTQLERMGEGPNREIENGILPIGAMEIAQLDNDPSFPERGTLVITMRGGR
jgi:hypothetical protein